MMTASILQCPVSGADLFFMEQAQLQALRGQITQGEVRHLAGGPVQAPLEAALSSSGGEFIYLVIDDILILVPSLAIVSANKTSASGYGELANETYGTMRFYDEVGWNIGKDGSFEDAERFEDLRPISRDYIRSCHLRVKEHIPPRGKYLLDVASGPVQYGEYLTYSEQYEYRICADISISALRAAKEKLGDKGIYIQCDITQLPLKNESVDGFVSLHTIYHVPQGKQIAAFRQLERVLRKGRSGVVVYTWGPHCLAMNILTACFRPVLAAKRLLRHIVPTSVVDRVKNKTTRAADVSATTGSGAALYYHPHDHNWFKREVASTDGWDVRVWRSVSVPFLKRYAHAALLGKLLLPALFRIENAFPHFFGKFGFYPMLVYRKAKE